MTKRPKSKTPSIDRARTKSTRKNSRGTTPQAKRSTARKGRRRSNTSSTLSRPNRPKPKARRTTRHGRPSNAAKSGSRRRSNTGRPTAPTRRAALHGPETFTIFSVTPQDIGGLDARRAVELVADLLWAEARRLGATATCVHVSSRIHVADGGVDATVEDLGPSDGSFLSAGAMAFQIKTGESFKTM